MMRKLAIALLLILFFTTACTMPSQGVSENQSLVEEIIEPTPTADPTAGWPDVIGPDPSPKVAAFYYPWYFTKEMDGKWEHWGGQKFNPPEVIASDYYPELGTYSESDPLVVAQHFAWMREAGIGLAISSWWGIGDSTDKALPLMLDAAEYYGIKIGFHVENYDGRSADSLKEDIHYLYVRYGDHPAFYWTTETSLYSPNDQPKGLFFMWASVDGGDEDAAIPSDYWRDALDEIHADDPGAIFITDQNDPDWVINSHFDGSYNYGVLDVDQVGYQWATGLPSGAWYVPGINPGFSARRIGYEDFVDSPRREGATYDDRWTRMFDVGIEPAMVVITTFNEWHEGTQIEPAAASESTPGGDYLDYESLPSDGYLTKTREWVDVYLDYQWPDAVSYQLKFSTTSDWTELALISGAQWQRFTPVSVSEEVTDATLFEGRLLLAQPLSLAESGNQVDVQYEIQLVPGESGDPLVFEIKRGGLGVTWVELYRQNGQDWEMVTSFKWAGNLGGDNAEQFSVAYKTLFGD